MSSRLCNKTLSQNSKQDWGCSWEAERYPGTHKALGLILSLTKKVFEKVNNYNLILRFLFLKTFLLRQSLVCIPGMILTV